MATFDPWAQLRLLELQECDTAINQLNSRLSKLPEAAALASLKSLAAELRTREVAAITETADLELEVQKAEADVDTVRVRSAKDQELLDSGRITDPKQLTELQHEVTSLGRRQEELEEVEMEILQRLEDAQKNLTHVKQLVADHAVAVDKAEAAHTVAVAEIEAEIVGHQARRGPITENIPAELLKLYEKLRADNGMGAAALYLGRCQGCGMELNPVALAKARSAADNELLRCEECKCILVRTAESGL